MVPECRRDLHAHPTDVDEVDIGYNQAAQTPRPTPWPRTPPTTPPWASRPRRPTPTPRTTRPTPWSSTPPAAAATSTSGAATASCASTAPGEMNYESVQSCERHRHLDLRRRLDLHQGLHHRRRRTTTSSTSPRRPTPTTRPTPWPRTSPTTVAVGITASASDADGTANTVAYTVHSPCAIALRSATTPPASSPSATPTALDREAGNQHRDRRATSTDGLHGRPDLHAHPDRRRRVRRHVTTDSDVTANTVAEDIANGQTSRSPPRRRDANATTSTR